MPFDGLHPRCIPCNYMDYYSFTDFGGMEGWVGLVCLTHSEWVELTPPTDTKVYSLTHYGQPTVADSLRTVSTPLLTEVVREIDANLVNLYSEEEYSGGSFTFAWLASLKYAENVAHLLLLLAIQKLKGLQLLWVGALAPDPLTGALPVSFSRSALAINVHPHVFWPGIAPCGIETR